MQRITEPKKSMITNLIESYEVVRSRPDFKVYPQMPLQQIHLFIKQAVRKQQSVIIQMNPTVFSKQMNEVAGKLSLSPHSSHVILTTETQDTIHLIQPRNIRHLRLA